MQAPPDVLTLTNPSLPPPAITAEEEAINAALQTPINFWGKVVDESGQPVPGATIELSTVDKSLGELMQNGGSRYKKTSDSNGLFSISGIKGAALFVSTSKEGYYNTGESGRMIGYAILNENAPPTPDMPAVLTLQKKGVAEPLNRYSSGGIRVPKDGTPKEISLSKGQVVPEGQGDFRVEVWTQDGQKDDRKRYPWRARVSAPGGGLVERQGQFDFVAPADGYAPSIEISMEPSMPMWQKLVKGEYFLKLRDGTFARMSLSLTTGGDHFFMIESFQNPKPGSRNLEYDPKQAVMAP